MFTFKVDDIQYSITHDKPDRVVMSSESDLLKCLNKHKQFDVFLRKIIVKISILSQKIVFPVKFLQSLVCVHPQKLSKWQILKLFHLLFISMAKSV